MKNSEKKLGASIWVLGMMISGNVLAQTCVVPPTCEELGYDKVASDCGSLAKLKCPFDDSKYFCTAYTDMNGKKIAEIGDYVYTDAISAEPISGRIPVGIVYDKSGKMMSIAQFTGETADQCNSYTADGTAGWKLAAMEDMGLIKSNVAKINASLAKLPNVPQIETSKQSGGTSHQESLSCMWKTSDGYACMNKSAAINGTSTCCDRSNLPTFPNYIVHALCIRTFSAGGAGKDPITTPTTYKVGDVYTDEKGTALGTVFEVEAGGQHGKILTRTSRSGTQNQAIEYCDSLNASTGLIWRLPTWDQMVSVCSKEISGYSTSSTYWTADGNKGHIYDSFYAGLLACSNKDNFKLSPDESYSYFCAAAF